MTDMLLIGATGMVGSAVIAEAGGAPLHVLARHSPPGVDVSRVTISPSEDWPAAIATLAPRILISALGTTIAQAGSQAAFRAVDHDLVLTAAGAARAAGTRHMIAVSSVGASAASRNFYLSTKGQVEDELAALGFDRVDLLRPGLLMGDRQGPRRTGEAMAMLLAPLTDALMQGPLRRYRSVRASAVARAILTLAATGGTGVHVHEHDAIMSLAD
ncbi:NAD-dependent dehydratase [Sphingomonas lacunae]|uniref:NAD-dependent dehydratase n=2 Tax=Sphingomonas lacunae TaxID=2698828 RepID=A0A6M4AX03_9SPHN|nr:NAD-dependent dehydratase [Sphingomonas lacunae]